MWDLIWEADGCLIKPLFRHGPMRLDLEKTEGTTEDGEREDVGVVGEAGSQRPERIKNARRVFDSLTPYVTLGDQLEFDFPALGSVFFHLALGTIHRLYPQRD